MADTHEARQRAESLLAAVLSLAAEVERLREERGEASKWLGDHFVGMEDDPADYSFRQMLDLLFGFGDQGWREAGLATQRADSLAAENAALRETLEPFAALSREIGDAVSEIVLVERYGRPRLPSTVLRVSDLRAAAAALAAVPASSTTEKP